MGTTTAGIIFGFLISTTYGSGFHVVLGGPARHITLYMVAAWLGFMLGHFIGDYLNITLLQLGVIHLFTASLGSWIALIASYGLVNHETKKA